MLSMFVQRFPQEQLAEQTGLLNQVKTALNSDHISNLILSMRNDYMKDREAAFHSGSSGAKRESLEFLATFAKYAERRHEIYAANAKPKYTELIKVDPTQKLESPAPKIGNSKEAKQFREAFNSIYADRSVQINTQYDPTKMSSYIDYSPYTWNYRDYLGVPTLSHTIDLPIQIATKDKPEIAFKDPGLSKLMDEKLQSVDFYSRLQRLLLYSQLSPRGSLIVPIADVEGVVQIRDFNDTQFSYAAARGLTLLDEETGLRQIFCLGHLLKHNVTAYFLCPGFEPIYGVGKNRVFQLKEAAEAINLYLYTIKVLCIRAQVIIEKWAGEEQTDTMISRLNKLSTHIDTGLSMSKGLKSPEGFEIDILNNNISDGFSKVATTIKEFQALLTGVAPDYLYGSDTAYSANSFNIHLTHQNIRSSIQEAQIAPVLRFVVNAILSHDPAFAEYKSQKDKFKIEFKSLYEPTEQEREENAARRIENIIKMASYPELEPVFKAEKLLEPDTELPKLPEPQAPTGQTETDPT